MNIKNIIAIALASGLLSFCNQQSNTSAPEAFIRNKEAREDSAKLAEAYAFQSKIVKSVVASVETQAVKAEAADDAADDPAFWMNIAKPESSVIYGSNKKGGIYAYSLLGKELAYYPVGLVNNIDVRQSVIIGNDTLDIIGASNRSDNSILLMTIDSIGGLTELVRLAIDTVDMDEVYGFCLHKAANNAGYAFVNGKDGNIHGYQLNGTLDSIIFNLVYDWKLDSQPEGMVVDAENNTLFIGEEELGIWKVSLTETAELKLLLASLLKNNEFMVFDIEGLAIHDDQSGDAAKGFLLASIQGSFSYAMFERSGSHEYLGSFKIISNELIDGVEETDGLEIVSYSVGDSFPNGMLIVQDGFNYEGDSLVSQNFKLVDLNKIIGL